MAYYYLSTTRIPANKMREPRILSFGTYTAGNPGEKYITFSSQFSQTPQKGTTLYVLGDHATLTPVGQGNLYNTLGNIATLTFEKALGPLKYVVR